MPEQREGGLLQLLGDHTLPKHQLRSSLPPAHTLSHTQQTQHILMQQFQHPHAHQHQINPDWITPAAPSASPANRADSEPARELAGASRSSLLDPAQPFSRTATQSPSPQRSLTPDLQLPVVTDASILNLTSLSRYGSFIFLCGGCYHEPNMIIRTKILYPMHCGWKSIQCCIVIFCSAILYMFLDSDSLFEFDSIICNINKYLKL